jgi:hypothetical protein
MGSTLKIKAECKNTEQDRRIGWLNMAYEEIKQQQLEVNDSMGG